MVQVLIGLLIPRILGRVLGLLGRGRGRVGLMGEVGRGGGRRLVRLVVVDDGGGRRLIRLVEVDDGGGLCRLAALRVVGGDVVVVEGEVVPSLARALAVRLVRGLCHGYKIPQHP